MQEILTKNNSISEIVLACFVPPGTGADLHKNRQSHGIAFNCDGEKKYVFNDGTVCTVKKNTIIFLPKHSYYRVVSLIPGGTYCINFQLSNEESFLPETFQIRNAEEICNAYRSAEKAWRQRKSGYILKCKSEIYNILYEIYKESTTPYVPESKINLIKPAVDYIHKNYTYEQIDANKLSQLCGISYEYFRRLFRLFYGCSPIEYINSLKLRHAKELLVSDLYSVSETAVYSGFSDISYFSRFFKKTVGVSPMEYKKNANGIHSQN